MHHPATRLAENHDLTTAADTLRDAFADYPWTRWVIPAEDYLATLQELQQLYLQHAHRHGIVLLTADYAGVAALLPADAPPPDDESIARIIELHGDRIDRLSSSDAAPGSWTLETLGVQPHRQGHGIGGLLLEKAVEEAQQRGASGLALHTSDLRNVRLYERAGFRVSSHATPSEGPEVWSMIRTFGTG
ncbi:GNAT family N-acetyltransferase [Rhodococcus fascians]|nr:GNAT family N-acetyltransferase [Rhodococcus fascians]MBY4136809.1 GNAT family N-acetyltransferase [Rhodococcus fascians]MBY4218613.1 GNAT family N-acetyltransferase [Rhodococcus fascians]MBY4221647.1 GNAT family N-acetyltransferase [Rhodococcus fascians]MBY4227762.1 GNAT family N-acetyltransferase [Rhodococcus fascians]